MKIESIKQIDKNKIQKIKDKSKKYFWEAKKYELKMVLMTIILIPIVVILSILFGYFLVVGLGLSIGFQNEHDGTIGYFFVGFIWLLLISLVIFSIIGMILSLIDSNKKEALRKALREEGCEYSYFNEDEILEGLK